MTKPRIPSISFELQGDRAILILCIGIALVFWLLVKMSQNFRMEKPVSVQIELPENLTFVESPPSDMVAELEGEGWDLIFDYFTRPHVELSYNLIEQSITERNRIQIRLDLQNQQYNSQIRVIDVNYDNMNLRLEEKKQKKIPVQLQAMLSFAPEYQLQEAIQLRPDSIEIIGPKSKLDSITAWNTDSLILQDLEIEGVYQLKLQKPVRGIQLIPPQVTIEVKPEQYTEKSFFVPLTIKNAPDSTKIFPSKIMLTCVVGLSRYESVQPQSFTLEVDLKDVPMDGDQNSIPIVLTQQPEYVRNVFYNPQSAEFFIQLDSTSTPPK